MVSVTDGLTLAAYVVGILGSGKPGADEEFSSFVESYPGSIDAILVCLGCYEWGPHLLGDTGFNTDDSIPDRLTLDCLDSAGESDLLTHICFRGISFD